MNSRGASITLSIVIPAYGSEATITPLLDRIEQFLEAGPSYEVIVVDDYSPDGVWKVLTAQAERRPWLKCVRLRKNFGQDVAILTGLRHARGEFAVIMDDDLQHDPEYIPKLFRAISESEHDVVYANFTHKEQAWWKNAGSWLNGKAAEWLIEKPSDLYLSPFKIVRREVVAEIVRYHGAFPYIEGLILQVTRRLSSIPATHRKRLAGRGNFTLVRSIRVWLRLAVSFSLKPLRLVTILGFVGAGLGGILATLIVISRIINPEEFAGSALGWASLIVTIILASGVQMIFLGVMGEYIGRTHLLVNQSPQTVSAETLNLERASDD